MVKQVGNDVFLKRTVRPYNRIAKATVESQDPSEMVGGTILGNECYKVVIDSPIFGDAELFRPCKNLNYIKDAIGHSIAWPIHLACPFLSLFMCILCLPRKSNMSNECSQLRLKKFHPGRMVK